MALVWHQYGISLSRAKKGREKGVRSKRDKKWIVQVHLKKNVYFCSKIRITMATKKEDNEKKLVKEQTEALLKLLLLKTGTKRSDLIKLAEQDFIYENLGILTMAEKQQFNRLAL